MTRRAVLQSVLWPVLACALLASCASAPEVRPSPATARERQPGVRELGRAAAEQPVPRVLHLPPAMRQLQEGYWLGAMFGPEHVPTLRALGIRVVVSAVRPSADARAALEKAGLAWVDARMGATFAHADEILHVLERYAPEEIFIHCRHGADRTGAIAAFILAVRHGWAVADALYSVVYASPDDVDGLSRVLREHGIEDVRTPDDPTVGFYSVRAAGGVGGLKARNARYGQLVATTVEAILGRRPGALYEATRDP